jgi:hypothetical protein
MNEIDDCTYRMTATEAIELLRKNKVSKVAILYKLSDDDEDICKVSKASMIRSLSRIPGDTVVNALHMHNGLYFG